MKNKNNCWRIQRKKLEDEIKIPKEQITLIQMRLNQKMKQNQNMRLNQKRQYRLKKINLGHINVLKLNMIIIVSIFTKKVFYFLLYLFHFLDTFYRKGFKK